MIPTCHQFRLHPLVRPFKKLTNHTNFLPFSWLKKFNKRVTVGLPFCVLMMIVIQKYKKTIEITNRLIWKTYEIKIKSHKIFISPITD